MYGQFGKPALVLYLGCPKHVAKDRFLTRDRSGRPTDNATIFERRYNEFLELNDPIVRYYESDQNMLAKVCGSAFLALELILSYWRPRRAYHQ